MQKWLVEATHSTWNFGSNWSRWSEIADFQSIFACSASAVTFSEKSSINTIGSPLRAFQWAQDKHRALSLSLQKRKVSKIWTIRCDNIITPKPYEIGCQLLLITNRKSHTGFRLVPTSMTLNDFEWRNSPYFVFFIEFDNFAGQLCHSG